MAVFFVSGIDTSCGKTFITGLLAKREILSGKSAITQKFVQTGCDGFSEDIAEHRRLMGVGLFPEDIDGTTCPYVFKFPASPHLSAKLEGAQIDENIISSATEKLSKKYGTVFVEGAGGLMVPVREGLLTIEYISQRKLPLILVVSAKLGSINHALLSFAACRYFGVNLAKVVFNNYPKEDERLSSETKSYIKKRLQKDFPNCEVEEF